MKKKTIVIFSAQGIKDLEPYILQYLKSKKFYIIFLVNRKQDVDFHKKNNLKFYDELLYVTDEIYEQKYIRNPSLNSTYKKKVMYYEKKLKLPIYKVFFTDRTIGVGFFASGGYNHPKTKAQLNYQHNDLLKLANLKLDFWYNLFKNKKVNFAMNLPLVGHIVAKSLNIHSKKTIIGKFKNTRDWTSGMYLQPDNIDVLFKKAKSKQKSLKQINLKTPLAAHIRNKKLFLKEFSFFNTMKTSLKFFLQHSRGKLKGYVKSKSIYLLSNFKSIWKRRNDFIKMKRLVNIQIEEAKKMNYIYFPLVTEPEVALHGIATDFFFQLSAINILSRDIPSNYKIIVKEPLLAIGRRPNQFYDQIMSLKNVMMADPLEVGLDYVKNAKIVACITGTSAWEAAVLGIPVLSFSKNNIINFLDHVYYVSNFYNSHKLIKKILRNNFPNNKSKKDGALLYKVYLNSTTNMKDILEFYSWKKSNMNEDKADVIKELMKKYFYNSR